MAWRDIMKVTADRTLTINDLPNIDVGDYLIPIVDGFDPKDDKSRHLGIPLFAQGKEYRVISTPTAVSKSKIVVESEKGNWELDFTRGAGKFFILKKLTDDERLGQLESLPYEIMKLLYEHGAIPRTRIITELMQIHYSEDVKDMKELRNDIALAIALLLRTGKIVYGDRVGMYKLSPEADRDIRLPYGPVSHE